MARGGAGGQSTGTAAAGAGGAATSNLTFDDTTNTKHASNVSGYARAYGGAGGAAAASLTLTGSLQVTAETVANGGAGGTAAVGGNATTTSDAIGTTTIKARALATGGNGGSVGGTASATAIGQGASGDASSASIAGNITGASLVTAANANTDAPFTGGKSTALTWAAIGNGTISAPAFVADQAKAQVTAEPKSTDVAAITGANSNIKAAFNHPNASFFGMGQVGGGYSTGGTGSQTDSSTVNLTVDLTKLASRQDLELGLFSGTSAGGSGFQGLIFTVVGDGIRLVNRSFNTAAAAVAFFTNDAIDLGSLSSGPLSANTLNLTITETLTKKSAGTHFDGGFLVGDPSPTQDAAAYNNFVAAMASFNPSETATSWLLTGPPTGDHLSWLGVNGGSMPHHV